MSTDDYLGQPLGRFLDLVAEATPAPGGGAAAAVAVALAAGLAGMAARLSARHMPDADALATRADALRAEVAPLAGADAAAYHRLLEALRSARADPASGPRVEAAVAEAADVPLAIAAAGAAVADLAALLASRGNPNLRGDAVTAALLAEAGTRASAGLVEIDLRLADLGDDRSGRCASLLAAAAGAAREAQAAL